MSEDTQQEIKTGVTDSGLEYTLATVKDVSAFSRDEEIKYEDYMKLKDIEIRVFKSSANRRLDEEDETFQEYELRRSIIKKAFKRKAHGEMTWNSTMWGTKTKEKADKLKQLIEDGKKGNG